MTDVPPDQEPVEVLRAAFRHGEALSPLLRVGAPAAPVRTYARTAQGLQLAEGDGQLMVSAGDTVSWSVTVGPDDVILGYSFSGYHNLMQVLGVDLSGAPYSPGEGG